MPELARLTWPEAKEALERARLGIVPVGSCEQHGPHMTLDTDIAIAGALARRLADDLGELALLLPPLGYGLSEHHLGFPGSLTLRASTFAGFLSDVVESLAHHGIRRVLVVNGHGGNVDAIRLAARAARRDHGALVAGVMWAQIASDEVARQAKTERYGHACEIETSVGMVVAPDSVHADRMAEPRLTTHASALTELPHTTVDRPTWFHEWTENGALGDPRLASAEIGEAIVAAAHEAALDFARKLADEPLPEPEDQWTRR
jgi:creatinine amidohydrolase